VEEDDASVTEEEELPAGAVFFEQEASGERHTAPKITSFTRLLFLDIRTPFLEIQENINKDLQIPK